MEEIVQKSVEIVATFVAMNLKSSLLENITLYGGMPHPSYIQQRAICPVLQGNDVVAQARSGNGKLIAFAICTLQLVDVESLNTQIIILSSCDKSTETIVSVFESIGRDMSVTIHKCTHNSSDAVDFRSHVVIGCPDLVHKHLLQNQSDDSLQHMKLIIIDDVDILSTLNSTETITDTVNNCSNIESILAIRYIIPKSATCAIFFSTMTPSVNTFIDSLKLREPVVKILDDLAVKKLKGNGKLVTKSIEDKASLPASGDTQVYPSIVWKAPPQERMSHLAFFDDRDWTVVTNFWSQLMKTTTLPTYITGHLDTAGNSSPYGVTDLTAIHNLGLAEYTGLDPRFKRKTFALRIGYDGSKYSGYQKQKGVENVLTVQDDLEEILGRTVTAAGRTDKDVTAVSQIIHFTTFDDISEDDILKQCRESEPVTAGRLTVFDCQRVPKRFHSLFSATWRRYIYLFPLKFISELNSGSSAYDVDVQFVNECFARLQGLALPYNGFTYRESRDTGEGKSDICTLLKATATVVDLSMSSQSHPHCHYQEVSSEQIAQLQQQCSGGSSSDELSIQSEGVKPLVPALCVELVGDRFLRRMVRILVATAVRESVLDSNIRDVDILYKIAISGDRYRASFSIQGEGLAFCGVGYDLSELSEYKHNVSNKSKDYSTDTKNGAVVVDSTECGASTTIVVGEIKESNKQAKKRVRRENTAIAKASQQTTTTPPVPIHNIAKSSIDLSSYVTYAETASSFWEEFKFELCAYDPDLLFFPQRKFEFSVSQKSILVNQTPEKIGTTVWDAEIMLAHFIDKYVQFNGNEIALELGAGTAIAGILCSKISSTIKVIVQELEEVLSHTLECFDMNDVTPYGALCGYWGIEMNQRILSLTAPNKVDYILLADVLYHTEDFTALLDTIKCCLDPTSGTVILVYEQRRKDLSLIVFEFVRMFESCVCHQYTVNYNNDDDKSSDFYIYIMTQFKKV